MGCPQPKAYHGIYITEKEPRRRPLDCPDWMCHYPHVRPSRVYPPTYAKVVSSVRVSMESKAQQRTNNYPRIRCSRHILDCLAGLEHAFKKVGIHCHVPQLLELPGVLYKSV